MEKVENKDERKGERTEREEVRTEESLRWHAMCHVAVIPRVHARAFMLYRENANIAIEKSRRVG